MADEMGAQTLRYGVIGTGMMGIEHLLNLRLVPGAVVSAIADPHPRSQKWGTDTAGPEAVLYSDYREMLRRAPLDVVIVATPNHTHAEVMDAVFESGKHVLLEKPMCTTVEDCRRVVDRAERHPGVVWVGMEYRYMPPAARLIEAVHGGAIGRLRMISIREHRFPFLPKVGDWNRFSRNTGGTLVEKCCHFFDLMNCITRAKPIRVYASGAMDVNHQDERYDGEKPDILDNAFALVDFDDGSRACLDLCMFAEASRNQEEICCVGDAGKVECFVPDSTLVTGTRHPRQIEVEAVPVDQKVLAAGGHHGSTYYEHMAFREAVLEGKPAAVSTHDGLMAVAVGAAAEQSAREGRAIEMSEVL